MVQNIVVRCSDGLKNQALTEAYPDDFIIANAGGIKWFLLEHRIGQLYDQIDIGIKLKHATVVRIISHQPCGLYRQLGQDKSTHYLGDLHQVQDLISKKFPSLNTELYLLDHTNDNQLVRVK